MLFSVMLVSPVIGLFPLQVEFDFTDLPQKARYEFTLKLETTAGEKLEIPLMIGVNADREDVQSAVIVGLKQSEWEARKAGLSVVVNGKGKNAIQRVDILAVNGIKPVIRWKLMNMKN